MFHRHISDRAIRFYRSWQEILGTRSSEEAGVNVMSRFRLNRIESKINTCEVCHRKYTGKVFTEELILQDYGLP